MSVVRATRAAISHMRQAGSASLSHHGTIPRASRPPDSGCRVATWAGMIGYAKTLRGVGQTTSRVNTICPGRLDTPLAQRWFGGAAKGDASRAQEMLDT